MFFLFFLSSRWSRRKLVSDSSSLYYLDLPSFLFCLDGNPDPLVQRESKDPPSPHMTGGDGSYCKGAGEPMETESELSPEDKQEKKVRGRCVVADPLLLCVCVVMVVV